ncbi:MAG: M48 family metallopeptidase [Phycisphaerales bacterium]
MTKGTASGVVYLGLMLTLLSGCAVNPATGEEEMMLFSPEKDVALGRKYAPSIEKALGGRIPDENLQNYVNQIGQRIARVCHRPDLSYYFIVVDDKMTNALALPGGYVYITRGLLTELKTEGQLAAVLAHETSHVVARDTMAAISRQIGMAALVAAVQVGSDSRSAAGGAGFVAAVLSLQYSREDEKDADLTGLSYMTQAGYDPNGMVETMKILQDLQTIRPVEFFSTHPNPESRIAYLEEKIARRYSDVNGLKTGRDEYAQSVLTPLNRSKNPVNTQIQETWGTK